jgi:catechol 2,3-dioxygenase-like lactoylglutathione lyase family enzyme
MPGRGIQHVDLAVSDVDRSLAFYMELLGPLLEHLAFEVDTREEVDAAHQRCSRRGDRIHHPPEQDSDIQDYYAFFVFDPDGLRIEVFSPGPEWSSRIHRYR